MSFPGVGNHTLRALFLSRGLDPQGPHPKIRETSPIAAGETESKFGSFMSRQRVIRSFNIPRVDNTHGTVYRLHREVDALGLESYQRVLAPRWFYLPIDERYSDVIEPKVALYDFVN